MTQPNARTAPENTTLAISNGDKSTNERTAHPDQNAREVASYVADMILELRNMSKSAKLYKVMVPLEFAYYEAFSAANHVEVPKAELERLQLLAEVAKSYEDGNVEQVSKLQAAAG